MNKLNINIIKYRRLSLLSQKETAKRLKMKASTYSQMERHGNITVDRLISLADIFQVSLLDLLEDIYEEPKITNNTASDIALPPKNKYIPRENSNSNEENNVISILRSLPKKEREELLNIIQKAYYDYKYRRIN
ncbi:MAG: helix-turn-helix domain-containing protein [Clostridia bacterium]|nr:helix-turn-helix domain-containing protein [Clostridia bacterium]